MNIWDFLQTVQPRKDSKTVQLVKHWDEVGERSKKDKMYGIQTKHDGVNANLVVHEGKMAIFSRTGKELQNTAILLNLIPDTLSDGVYQCELVCDSCSLEVLSGVVNPNRVNKLNHAQLDIPMQMYLQCFDFVKIEDFIRGESDICYKFRHHYLCNKLDDWNLSSIRAVHMEKLITSNDDAMRIAANSAIKDGEEGIVIVDMDAGWVAGHKGYRKMKIVRGVSYDLECIGYEQGTGKLEGHVCNLIFNWKDGNHIKAIMGKGWTYDMMQTMYTDILSNDTTFAETTSPLGKIFEVYALQESSKGVLRQPKVGELRHDKETSDV